MTRFCEALTGWGTLIGSTVATLSLAGMVIAYAARMEGDIAHCTRTVERVENHVETISENVAKTREAVAKIEGQLLPIKVADSQTSHP